MINQSVLTILEVSVADEGVYSCYRFPQQDVQFWTLNVTGQC